MKKILAILLSIIIILSLTACGGDSPDESQSKANSAGVADSTQDTTDMDDDIEKILVAYFSHTGENYSVGVIEKGNTEIIAEIIAEKTGADLFEIVTVNPYPSTYKECTDVAKAEQNENARPQLASALENRDDYDVLFIGYPIWWGDMPMAVYTFLGTYDFNGKTVIPFCTHEGSGLAGTGSNIQAVYPNSNVLTGRAIKGSVAQNDTDSRREDILGWLEDLGY